MVYQYKCPDCGADMTFDAASGMLSCDSCGRKDSIKKEDDTSSQNDEPIYDYEELIDQTNYATFGNEAATQYMCNNCGAVLITSSDTTATTCSFCGAPMILGDRLAGELAPANVIPFKITKEQAQEAFKKWCRKGRLTPKGFLTADRIKSITGIYVPFWLFDLNARGTAHADCTRTRHYRSGDYAITETRHYDIFRKVDINYEKLPCDASEKMNDKLMDKLEPYQYDELYRFEAPYLAGYIAERYNYTDKQLFNRASSRIQEYSNSYIRNTIHGYDTVHLHHNRLNIQQKNAEYTLLPVWSICYDYQNAEHSFAMNGQTGKVVGKPPLSKGKIAAHVGGITALLFILLRIFTILAGGDIL